VGVGLVTVTVLPVAVVLIKDCQKPGASESEGRELQNEHVAGRKVGLSQQEAPDVEIEDPWYKAWAKFRVGTVVIQETVGGGDGVRSHVRSTHTLLELSTRRVVVETVTATTDFNKQETTKVKRKEFERWRMVPNGTTSADLRKPLGTIDEGVEVIPVCGVTVQAKWYECRFEQLGVQVEGRMWLSDDYPVALRFVTRFSKGGGNKDQTLTWRNVEQIVEIKKP
jgi:hypothetical protein